MRTWLKEKRTEAGLTMAQMAEKLEITEGYYSFIEAGKRQKPMDIVMAAKLSDIFMMPVAEIIREEAK